MLHLNLSFDGHGIYDHEAHLRVAKLSDYGQSVGAGPLLAAALELLALVADIPNGENLEERASALIKRIETETRQAIARKSV